MFSLLRKQKRFPEGRARFYAAQVFLALQYLHKMGYVYRDLKPENILFDTNGYLKVSDYGLSKRLQAGEKTYSITGTASYLSKPRIIKVLKFYCVKVTVIQQIGGLSECSSMK